MRPDDFSDLDGDMSAQELAEVMAAAKAAGMVGQITFVDDPDSPEGREAIEYVNSHHWLPKNYRTLLRSEVEALGKTLFDPEATILDKKKALMLLGHRGSIEAYRILKSFVKQSPAELKVWSKMAFDESKTFLATELSEETQFGFNFISQKIGRNAPCPCGSGKKYKRCCGAGE
jgi:uncharacterized protein YchJ